MSIHSKIPLRIQSAPPDEGEPNLKAPYNVGAEEFKPSFVQNSKLNTQKKELRADAVSYEPQAPPSVANTVSNFPPKKELSVKSPPFELNSFASAFIPDFKPPNDIEKIKEFHFEPTKKEEDEVKKGEIEPVKTIETFPASQKLLDTDKGEENQEDQKKGEENGRLEDGESAVKNESLNEVEGELVKSEDGGRDEGVDVVKDEDKVKVKRVYDFDSIKRLKSEFLKDPNFLLISMELTKIKDREVEILKKGKGGRRYEERKGSREGVIKVTWRKAKTAEEQKISDKAKEYKRKFSATLDEQKLISKQIRITLNKLSPNNLERLSALILETCKKSHDYLKLVVSGIFEKAWAEKKYTQMYSDICKNLKIQFEGFRYPDTDESKLPRTKNYFKYELLFMCEDTFISKPEEIDMTGLTEEQKSEKLSKIKQKILGNVRFIGELFNVSLITGKIVLECVNILLSMFESENNEDKLEGACLLLFTGGASFERSKLKENTDKIYQRLQKIMEMNITPRIRFKILDLVEFRASGWKTVQKEELKTVEKIHEEHREEQNEILRRHKLSS